MLRTEQQWLELFHGIESIWKLENGQEKYHSLLTKRIGETEKHSDLYINSAKIVSRSQMLAEVCNDLLEKLILAGLDIEKVDCVIGPAHGATTIASRLAEAIAEKRSRECFATYATKNDKSQTWEIPRLDISGLKILGIEDTVSTLGNMKGVISSIKQQGGIFIHIVGSICNRSGKEFINGVKVVSLVCVHGQDWEDSICPLCREGSKAISPKEKGNWKKLHNQN